MITHPVRMTPIKKPNRGSKTNYKIKLRNVNRRNVKRRYNKCVQ